MVVNEPYNKTAIPPELQVSWRVKLAQNVLMGRNESPGRLRQMGQAIAVGILGKQALNNYMGLVYEDCSSAYDPIHYSLDCEAKILPYLAKYHRFGKLLSAFCGQGREARFFAEQRFEVTGIDANAAMIGGAIAYAKTANFSARFELADFLKYQPAEPYDVVYLSPWMYDTFPDPADRMRLLQQCAAMLGPGGVIVISYARLAQPNRIKAKIRHWLSTTAATVSGSAWRPKFGDRFYVGIFHHFFAPGELKQEIDAAGLKILAQQESANGLFDFCILSAKGLAKGAEPCS